MTRWGRSAGRDRATAGRRSGPADEEPWWDPADQACAERSLLDRRHLGRGWVPAVMVNNVERLDPLGGDEASEVVRAARRDRRLTGLDDGQAWRTRSGPALAVVRHERFADPDDRRHRQAWRDHGEASLRATWQERWRERDRQPGWVEARWVPPADRPDPLHAWPGAEPAAGVAAAVDWARIEDHTGDGDEVTVYEHLTLWAGRSHVTLTLRHRLGDDLDAQAAGAAVTVHRALEDLGRAR